MACVAWPCSPGMYQQRGRGQERGRCSWVLEAEGRALQTQGRPWTPSLGLYSLYIVEWRQILKKSVASETTMLHCHSSVSIHTSSRNSLSQHTICIKENTTPFFKKLFFLVVSA